MERKWLGVVMTEKGKTKTKGRNYPERDPLIPENCYLFLASINTWSQNIITLCHLLFMVCLIRSFVNITNI